MEIREIQYDSVDYQKAKQLREAILRKPLGLWLTESDTKEDEQNLHFGVFTPTEELIACVLLQPVSTEVVQLRQMAVNLKMQNKGMGKCLIQYVENQVKSAYRLIELNARMTAQSFYEHCGYQSVGEPFTHIGIPHIKMQKLL